MAAREDLIVNIEEAEEIVELEGERFGSAYKVLTTMQRVGRLGVNLSRVPPGRTAAPFHTHQRDDEVFLVLSGRGVLRYGERIFDIGPGDCISCPAGTGVGHQLANTGEEDLCYLAIGRDDPDEVCTYPDSGKVMVRSLGAVGRLERRAYSEGEPEPPRIFEMAREQGEDRLN